MITFKQYLNEKEGIDLKTLLERDCEFFLEEVRRNGLLVRGMHFNGYGKHVDYVHKNGEEDMIEYHEKTVRTDRKPLDTHPTLHQKLDDWFFENFGQRPRTQAMFCFGDSRSGVDATDHYGTTYAVFPIGKFEYVWSPDVQDLYSQMEESGDNKYLDSDEDFDEYMKGLHYRDDNLWKAVTSKNELMVSCKKYYAFDYHAVGHILREALNIE